MVIYNTDFSGCVRHNSYERTSLNEVIFTLKLLWEIDLQYVSIMFSYYCGLHYKVIFFSSDQLLD